MMKIAKTIFYIDNSSNTLQLMFLYKDLEIVLNNPKKIKNVNYYNINQLP